MYVIKLCKVKGKGQTVTYLSKHTGELDVQIRECLFVLYLSVNTHVETCGRKDQ